MYFVWKGDSALSDKYMHVSVEPRALEHDEWITGRPLLVKPKVMTMTGDDDSPATLSDVILTGFNLPVLSPKAIAVLKETGVDNLEYFPVQIKHPDTKTVEKSYQIANVVGKIDCLDRKHATLTTFVTEPDEISYLSKYRIFEDKVIAQGSGKKPPLVFRLGEFTYHVLAHESVKKAFEKAGLTGAAFVPTEKFA